MGDRPGSRWRRIGPLSALDASIVIETPDETLADLLTELYGALPETTGDHVDPLVLQVQPPLHGEAGTILHDGAVVGRSKHEAALLDRLIWYVNQHVIQATAERLLLHAAAASLGGDVVLLPGMTGAGKSTMVAGLVGRGAAYLTDEASSVAPDLTVEGFAKPISLRTGAWDELGHLRPDPDVATAEYVGGTWHVDPRRAGAIARSGRLAVVVFPRHRTDAGAELVPLGPGDALALALSCTFVTERDTMATDTLRAVAAVMEAVPCYELGYGELAAACDAVLPLLN